MRPFTLLTLGLALPGPAAATSGQDSEYEFESTPCGALPVEPPEFVPPDGATDVPKNLVVAFARWPALECDFEVRSYVDGAAEPISTQKFWFAHEKGTDAWKRVGLDVPGMRAGQRFRVEVYRDRYEQPAAVAHFQLGEQTVDPPDPDSADVSGSSIDRTDRRSGGQVSLDASWPEVAGTPFGFATLRAGESDVMFPEVTLLPDQDGDFSFEAFIPLPALKETCATATVYSSLLPDGDEFVPRTNHRFCRRRSVCAAAPGAGLVPILIALFALVARRR